MLAGLLLIAPLAAAQSVNCTPSTELGEAAAVSMNPVGETIVRERVAEDGIASTADGASTADALAVNRGTIITCGGVYDILEEARARFGEGVRAIVLSGNGSSTVTNEVGAFISTRGIAAGGMSAQAAGGKATAINRGAIRTSGSQYIEHQREGVEFPPLIAADGMSAVSAMGAAEVRNEQGARIEVTGDGGRGMVAQALSGSGTVTGINRGIIITRGQLHTEGTFDLIPTTRERLRQLGRLTLFPVGMFLTSYGTGDVNAVNYGEIDTYGQGATGVNIFAHEGIATATNYGRITVHNLQKDPELPVLFFVNAHGFSSTGGGDLARAINEASGVIETKGDDSYALSTLITNEHSGTGEAINRGRIITNRDRSHGIFVSGNHAGNTEDGPNTLRAVNAVGGTVSTKGNISHGVAVTKRVSNSTFNFGSAVAENHGTIDVSGDFSNPNGFYCYGPSGVSVIHSILNAFPVASPICRVSSADTHHTGDVKAINTGIIRATGRSNAGISAINQGNGRTIVEMTGGSVVAGSPGTGTTDGKFGIGIMTTVHTDHATSDTDPDPTDDIDLEILVSGSSTTVTAYSEEQDNPETVWDDSQGIGILGMVNVETNWVSLKPDLTGHMEVRVFDGATVTADRALLLAGAKAEVRVFNSTLNGRVSFDHHVEPGLDDLLILRSGVINGPIDFGGGDDLFTIENRGYATGDIDFGAGTEDTLMLDVSGTGAQASSVGIDGEISGLENLTKKGSGQARVGNVESSEGTFTIENGELIVVGHLNLGSTGTVTIQAGSRLTFEVGDISSSMENHGRITAGNVVFQSGAPNEVFVQLAAQLSNEDAVQTRLQQGIDLLEGDTSFQSVVSGAATDSDQVAIRTISGANIGTSNASGAASFTANADTGVRSTVEASPADASPPAVAVAESDSNNALYAGAALALLWWLNRDDAETQLVDYETRIQNFANVQHHKQQDQGAGFWVKKLPEPINGRSSTQGFAAGMDAGIGNHGSFNISMTPNTSGFMKSDSLSLGGHSSYTGNSYQIRGQWQGDVLFATGSVSHGDYTASTRFNNPATEDGMLGGSFGMSHNHFQITAGTQLQIGDSLMFVPSLSAFHGSVKQDAYRAGNSVLLTEVPNYLQRYRGWKLGFQIKPSKWITGSGDLKWIPRLGFSTQRFRTSQPSSLTLRQFDRTGALAFTNKVPVRGLPSAVSTIKAGLTAVKSRNLQVKLDYVGLMINDHLNHGAMVRTRLEF